MGAQHEHAAIRKVGARLVAGTDHQQHAGLHGQAASGAKIETAGLAGQGPGSRTAAHRSPAGSGSVTAAGPAKAGTRRRRHRRTSARFRRHPSTPPRIPASPPCAPVGVWGLAGGPRRSPAKKQKIPHELLVGGGLLAIDAVRVFWTSTSSRPSRAIRRHCLASSQNGQVAPATNRPAKLADQVVVGR